MKLDSSSNLKPDPEECVIKKPTNVIEAFNNMMGFVPIHHPQISNKLYDGFLLPIDYLDKTQRSVIPNTVSADLELFGEYKKSSSESDASKNSMYELFCSPSNEFGKMLVPESARQCSINVEFLKETQTVVERQTSEHGITQEMSAKFQEVWAEIKEDRTFLDRHSFMEFVVLEDLNKSRPFLTVYSLLNLVSPIYGLIFPLIILLLPFVILKIWKVPISFDVYLTTLREVSKQHLIGRIFNIKELNFENAIYVLFIGGMYFLQTYNQVISCMKYHQAVKRMNENLLFLRDYLDRAVKTMEQFVKTNSDLPYYSDFCQDVHSNKLVLLEIATKIGDSLTPYGWTLTKISELGHMFDCYYQLYSSIDYESSLKYSVGFLGYIDILTGVARGLRDGRLGKIEFAEDSDHAAEFQGQYYPALAHSDAQKNNIDLSFNAIITGVNASGKTTTLKTTALNVIFSQQFGCGFYASGTLTPFHHIHSYLNIPDTSGRDSLFQAESRRCKEILDKIRDSSSDDRHLCIFDELYSGTNPAEAAKSAHSLLKYLSQKPNVRFILTTHYVSVCRKFKKSDVVKNYKMVVEQTDDGQFLYKYKIRPGISTLEGGVAILKTMDYPQEIINTINANE
jgi:hypothetical protein